MKNKVLISETIKSVIYIGNKTYHNFLDSFNFSQKSYNSLTNLECEIFALQCFNLLYGGDIGIFTRRKLNKKCYESWIHRYDKEIKNENLAKALEYRLKESYLHIFKKAKNENRGTEYLVQDLHQYLIRILRNTENLNSIEFECPPIPVDALLRLKFIELEMGNFKVAATISQIFHDGMSDSLEGALKIIDQYAKSTNR